MSDAEQYAQYFTSGLKITVCIPLENNELFRDWARVATLEENLITLEMSRDELPAEVNLVAGMTLDLRFSKEGMGYRCGGVYSGEAGFGKIQLRLTGGVGTGELREFFRIDAFLPFNFQFSQEQNLDVLIGVWRKRKQVRLASETERREAFNEKQKELLFKIAAGEFDAEERDQALKQSIEEFNPIDETWDYVNATAMNLSAGGFKFVTTDLFKMDDLVFVEMFLPTTPPRIMDCISRVVFKGNNYSIKGNEEYYNVALNFVIIDDRERDAIISHITNLESLRIRQKGYLPIVEAKKEKKGISPLNVAISILFLAVMSYLIYYYFYDFSRRKDATEFQDTFGEGVKKYREQTGQKW